MTQFDPSMVAQMLMQPVGKESLDQKVADENYFQPIDIPLPGMLSPLDMQGGFFMSPETAKKVAYGGAVAGASFVPGAGFVDAAGGAVDVTGQPLLSFGENIGQGNYLDAALQGLGVAGDMATFAAPFTAGTSLALAAMLKAPGAARKVTKATDVASDVGSITRSSTLNEKGFDTDLVLYHGSSKPLKSVNDQRGLYLSPSSDVANFYTNPSYSAASKLASDFEDPAPNITPVHIKTEQIFDTRKSEHRKIFEEKFLNSYGNQTGIGEKGLPDWTDGEDFKEFFENENLPFKGVILDEGGFLDESGQVVDRGVSYAIFDKDSVTPVLSDFDNVKVTPPTETQPGIIAFHGSGADFDEFNLEYIDTGEGAQAFGHGLYFSNSKDIGDFYKNALTRSVDIDGKPYIRGNSIRNTELLDPDIADELGAANGDLELAIKNEEEYLQTLTGSQPSNTALDTATKETQKRIEKLKALRGRVTVNPTEGKTYKVAIQPKPEELLDYDLPLSEQPKILEKIENLAAVKKLREEGVNAFSPDDIASFFELNQIEKFNGQEFLRFLEDAKTTSGKDVVSKELNNVGIKGIKYKAGQLTPRKFKAADEKQSENYVIFDDKIIKVLEKYGIVGPVAVSATAAALRDDDGST